MNSCFKKIGLFLFAIALFATVLTGIAKASDQTINCTSTGCSGLSGALFNETNIAPGDSITRTLHVSNADNPDSCNLTMSATITDKVGLDDFTTKLFTVIKVGSSDVYGLRDGTDKAANIKTLGNLSGDTPISLGPIAAGADKDYNWTVYFDKDSNDDYQEASAKFDLNLTFVCGNPSLSDASATPCQDTPPAGAPYLLSVTPGLNSATLTWNEAFDPVSYYLVAYGTSHGVYQYGNPGIGGKGKTSYTVTNLSGDTTYYFVVRAGNGCAPGPFSNELSVSPTGEFIAGPAEGFLPGVLGTQDQEGEKGIKDVKGVSNLDKNYLWWLPLAILILFVFLAIYYFLNRSKKNGSKNP